MSFDITCSTPNRTVTDLPKTINEARPLQPKRRSRYVVGLIINTGVPPKEATKRGIVMVAQSIPSSENLHIKVPHEIRFLVSSSSTQLTIRSIPLGLSKTFIAPIKSIQVTVKC